MTGGRSLRAAAAALAALGLFSLGFSLLAERNLWPRLPDGALHGTDLVAGFAVAIGLVALLARRPPRTVPLPGGRVEQPELPLPPLPRPADPASPGRERLS
jgi:hypothetical protein